MCVYIQDGNFLCAGLKINHFLLTSWGLRRAYKKENLKRLKLYNSSEIFIKRVIHKLSAIQLLKQSQVLLFYRLQPFLVTGLQNKLDSPWICSMPRWCPLPSRGIQWSRAIQINSVGIRLYCTSSLTPIRALPVDKVHERLPLQDILFIVNFSFNQNENKNGPFFMITMESVKENWQNCFIYTLSLFTTLSVVATGAFYLLDLNDFNELLTTYHY